MSGGKRICSQVYRSPKLVLSHWNRSFPESHLTPPFHLLVCNVAFPIFPSRGDVYFLYLEFRIAPELASTNRILIEMLDLDPKKPCRFFFCPLEIWPPYKEAESRLLNDDRGSAERET